MEYEKQGDSGLFERDYFDSLLVETRYIDSRMPDTSFTMYGKKFTSPIMLAALPSLENADDGHQNLAEAGKAGEAGLVFWVETEEKEELSEIVNTGAATVSLIKPYADNKTVISRIEQAQKCGAMAVGIDVSRVFDDKGACNSWRGIAMGPKSMEEIREFVSCTDLPFIVRGILSERDAYKCIMAGAQGIVISGNYNAAGCGIPPLMALPDVLKAVNMQMPVFVDCEITSGKDAFKALALGAAAVFVRQEAEAPINVEGANDVFEKMSNMNDELKSIMAQTGCYNLSHMDKTVLRQIRMM